MKANHLPFKAGHQEEQPILVDVLLSVVCPVMQSVETLIPAVGRARANKCEH